MYLLDNSGKPASFFHDIPLNLDPASKTLSMVVEIPRYTQSKFEISKELPYNPIAQDTKKGKLRFVNNVFPFHGYPFNYGAFPQTWEDPTVQALSGKKLFGDNDPLDVVELGSRAGKTGEIKTVKVLGALAMIDDGEMDWKIIVIDQKDPMAGNLVNGIKDVEKYMPGALPSLRTWFKNYKRPAGKPSNEFAFGGKYMDAEGALKVIDECHGRWEALINGEVESKGKKLPEIKNTSVSGTPGYGNASIKTEKEGQDADVPSSTETVYYYRD